MKLTFDTVPKACWGRNVREAVSQDEWDKIRRHVYGEAGYICTICGAYDRLHAHEIWEYDDLTFVQRLNSIVALCELCHRVKHFGRTKILAAEGKLDLEEVIAHFINVNACSREEFEQHRRQSWVLWTFRSCREWITDLGDYSRYLEPFELPDLEDDDDSD